MNERLQKQWQVTEGLLQSAAAEIISAAYQQKFAELISHNELGLALDALEDAASEQKVSVEFWWHMKKAAEVMGQTERRKDFQIKWQECRRAQQDS